MSKTTQEYNNLWRSLSDAASNLNEFLAMIVFSLIEIDYGNKLKNWLCGFVCDDLQSLFKVALSYPIQAISTS